LKSEVSLTEEKRVFLEFLTPNKVNKSDVVEIAEKYGRIVDITELNMRNYFRVVYDDPCNASDARKGIKELLFDEKDILVSKY